MSNSERFRVDKDPKVIEFKILLRSSTLLQVSSDHGCVLDASSSSQEDQKEEGKCEGHAVSSPSSFSSSSVTAITVSDDEFFGVIKMREGAARTRTTILELGGGLDMDEDDNGFTTPTSLDHRIPVIQECPPAPRKPKSSCKRKASFSSSTRRKLFMLDLSDQEIGSLFPPALLAEPSRKIKKVRGGEDDTK